DFELKVAKVDQDNQPVLGVEFELTNLADGTKVKLQADDVNGNLFTFSSLKPGNYELKETVTPNNYVGLEQPIKISINESAKMMSQQLL
ncbi:MAG: prealbumin-like fold domain-containing protein, partial [Vagococcus sp.]